MTRQECLAELLPVLRKYWGKSARGTGLMSDKIVVRGAELKHHGLIYVFARKHQGPFKAVVRWTGRFFLVSLEEPQ